MKPKVVIVSRIFEGDSKWPVLVHLFYGQTVAEARAIKAAHLRSDAFLRQCSQAGRFSDFSCRVTEEIKRI